MVPDERFVSQTSRFWANVRAISESVGYSVRGEDRVKAPTLDEIIHALATRGLDVRHVIDSHGHPTEFGSLLSNYLDFRASTLNHFVRQRLMRVEHAADIFQELRNRLNPGCPIPMNKQRGNKRAPAYFTGIINMIIEANSDGISCNFNPNELITATRDGQLAYTSSRRLDGAFPETTDPIAVWEIKEQYYTTTFGSRVAAGVYESLLDGMELTELRSHEDIMVKHYFMLDAYDTWWGKGRSYLCRIVDMLHMGYVDEVLFGYEVVERLPAAVHEWVYIARRRL
ncbi:MAG: hypothetical protein OXC95_10425 [Dehalococcoidia bacterium]|nr:hypothetical protein [Dehalococcoidia bacterium]